MRAKRLFCIAAALLVALPGAFSACSAQEGEEIGIMTWNVYLGNGDAESFAEVFDEALPDVIQMQEANPAAYAKFITPLLARHPGYYVFAPLIEGEQCRTPILFDTEKFSYADGGAELLTDCYEPSRAKTLAWLLLETAGGQQVLFLNFHGVKCLEKYEGYADKTPEERAEVEAEWHCGNAAQVLARRKEVFAQWGELPCILTGDCNFDETEPAYAVLTDAGMSDAEKTARDLRSKDGLRTTHALGLPAAEGLTIDHVFGNGLVRFDTHEVIRTEAAHLASDHCPLLVSACVFGGK